MTPRFLILKLTFGLMLLSFFIVSSVFGDILHVELYGSDVNGDGSVPKPFKTITKALSASNAGDTISIGDGTYSEGQLVVPVGVSITSKSKNYHAVKLQPNTNLNVYNPFIKLESTPGSNGNQSISHIEINGINYEKRAYLGILVKSRDNVRIHNCFIHDFYGSTYKAAAVSVLSAQISPTDKWWELWPADPQTDGVDNNINTLWPGKPVKNFKLDNNVITEGGFKDVGRNTTGAVQLWHLKDSVIHHNKITTTSLSKGQCITGMGMKTALLDNVDIYNNTLDNFVHSDKANFSIETWVHKGGCDFYNNSGTGWYSITVGKNTSVFGNSMTISPPETERGIGIEFNMQSYSAAYGNYIENARWGIIVGFANRGEKNWITRQVTVNDNVFYSNRSTSIIAKCHGAVYNGYQSTVEGIDIFNNKIVGYSDRGILGVAVSEVQKASQCSLSDVKVFKNIITGMVNYAGKTEGTVDNLQISDNNFYLNNNDSWQGSNTIRTDTTDLGSISLVPPVFYPDNEQTDENLLLTAPKLRIVLNGS